MEGMLFLPTGGVFEGLIALIVLIWLIRRKGEAGPQGPINWADKKRLDDLADQFCDLMEAGLQANPSLHDLYYLYIEQLPITKGTFYAREAQHRAAAWRACAIQAGFDPEKAGWPARNTYIEAFDLGWQAYGEDYEDYS